MMAKLISLLAACIILSGCAVLKEDNRYITNVLDNHAAPESNSARIILAPVSIPVGFCTLAVDGGLINPIVQIPEALDDASAVFDIEFTGPFEIIVLPMRIVTFSAIFVVSETARCTLPF